MTIQQRIFKIMREKGITQNDLAQATGIPASTVSAWKIRNSCPPADKIHSIAKCLKVSAYDLLGINESDDVPPSGVIAECTVEMQSDPVLRSELQNSGRLPFNNQAVIDAYNSLTERAKLEVQIYILDKASEERRDK